MRGLVELDLNVFKNSISAKDLESVAECIAGLPHLEALTYYVFPADGTSIDAA